MHFSGLFFQKTSAEIQMWGVKMKKGQILSKGLIAMIVILLSVITMTFNASAKEPLIVEQGFIASYGPGKVGESHRNYKVAEAIFHIGLDTHKLPPETIPDTNGRFTLYLEPQYNRVIRSDSNYEFGLGF